MKKSAFEQMWQDSCFVAMHNRVTYRIVCANYLMFCNYCSMTLKQLGKAINVRNSDIIVTGCVHHNIDTSLVTQNANCSLPGTIRSTLNMTSFMFISNIL